MSAQRARSAVRAEHRSIHPNLPGLPWWAAIAVAALTTAIGVALDAGSGGSELTDVFAALYVLGCLGAVLAVRQSGLFTAVIQPPLILFCAVPAAYWMFHGATFTDLKSILINCGYPLIERFPLMLFTSAGVLLIGMARWYFGAATRSSTPRGSDAGTDSATGPGLMPVILATAKQLAGKLAAVLHRDSAAAARPAASAQRRQRDAGRSRRTATVPRESGSRRHAGHAAPVHSRRGRPPAGDAPHRDTDRPRQRRPAPARTQAPLPPPSSRRRSRPQQNGSRHGQPARGDRMDPYRPSERFERPQPSPYPSNPPNPSSRPIRPNRPSPPYSPYPSAPSVPPGGRRAPYEANGDHDEVRDAGTTHHPISRVRYRGPDQGNHTGESGRQPSDRPSRPRRDSAKPRKYDR